MPSFGEELGRLIPHMRRFAKALVRGHSGPVADDLVQASVVLAMRAERLARGSQLRAWCFANLIRMHRLRDHDHPGPARAHPQGGPPQDRALLAFRPREIARLDLLPLDQREVLLLVTLVGMTYAEVAETLHVTTETVISRLDAARAGMARGQRAGVMTDAAFALRPKTARAARYLHVVK